MEMSFCVLKVIDDDSLCPYSETFEGEPHRYLVANRIVRMLVELVEVVLRNKEWDVTTTVQCGQGEIIMMKSLHVMRESFRSPSSRPSRPPSIDAKRTSDLQRFVLLSLSTTSNSRCAVRGALLVVSWQRMHETKACAACPPCDVVSHKRPCSFPSFFGRG